MKHLLAIIVCLTGLLYTLCGGDFAVVVNGGKTAVLFRGKTLISDIASNVTDKPQTEKRQNSFTVTTDGKQVWNLWSSDPDSRFRTEIALSRNGNELEITYMTEADAYSPNVSAGKTIRLELPFADFAGKSFSGYAGRATAENRKQGKISPDMPDGQLENTQWRFLEFISADGRDKLTFDFNPIGPGDFISVYHTGALRGLGLVMRKKDKLVMLSGSRLREDGGFTGAKLRLTSSAAGNDIYRRDHALRKFTYDQPFAPQTLLCFGAAKYGSAYRSGGTAAWRADSDGGWLGAHRLQTNTGRFPGAYYSNISGENAVYRLNNMRDGWYFITVGAGNYDGTANNFSIRCNGKSMAEKLQIKRGECAIVTMPLRVTGGRADIAFSGKFILSTIAAQYLLAEAEDFSFRRGPWVTDGYEPGKLFRNAHYRPEVKPGIGIERFQLPEPGREAAAPRRVEPSPAVATVAQNSPGLAWRNHAVIGNCLGNSATLGELDNPQALERFLDEQSARHVNTLFVSGLHSRHTYFRHLERGRAAIGRIAAAAQKRGMKVIDHHDATLLWNLDGGFRVMCERPDELTRNINNNLPGFQFCIMNKKFNAKYTAYLLEQLRSGVDGFMLDEVMFYPDCCGCGSCREAFRADTNWEIPVNELDPFFRDANSPLRKVWQNWRKRRVGDWWVALRRKLNTVNPDVSLVNYTTHYGFVDSYAPLRLGTDLCQVARGADFFGTEIMSRNVLRSARAIVPYRKAKNLLRRAYGTPIWGLVTTQYDWDGAYFGWAMVNMHAQSAWINPPSHDRGRRSFERFADRNMPFAVAEPMAAAALLFSGASRDNSPTGGFRGELFGTAQTLESMHVPYEIIGEMSLKPEVLKKYRVLIAAGSSCLSDREIAALKEFVKDGGRLFLSGNSGFYDENGQKRTLWPFADIFKWSPTTAIREVRRLTGDGDEVCETAVPVRHSVVPPGVGTLATAGYGRGEVTFCAAFAGSQLCADEGTPGRVWTFRRDAALDLWYRRVLTRLLRGAQIWSVEMPETVFATLYRLPDRTAIHFLNAAGSGANVAGRPMPQTLPDPAFPVPERDIVFSLPLTSLRSAYAVSPDFPGRRELKYEKISPTEYRVTLPAAMLRVYTIVNLMQ